MVCFRQNALGHEKINGIRASSNSPIILKTIVFSFCYSFQLFNLVERVPPMARTVQCIKLGTEAEGLDFPPYPGDLGKRIWEGVSKQAWADWLKHQTMLVNENRLNLADLRARQYLARQMENHFFGSGADAAQGYVPPAP
jgi:Fe-S cluster biosynthesis and repair protein YggX